MTAPNLLHYAPDFNTAYVPVRSTFLFSSKKYLEYDLPRLYPDYKPLLLQSYFPALLTMVQSFMKIRKAPTSDDEILSMFEDFFLDKNYTLICYVPDITLRLKVLQYSDNLSILGGQQTQECAVLSPELVNSYYNTYYQDIQAVMGARKSIRFSKRHPSVIKYNNELINCSKQALAVISNKIKAFRAVPNYYNYKTTQHDMTCAYCIDLVNGLQTHRERLIEKRKSYVYYNNQLVALSVDPRENKIHNVGKKILIIPSTHMFPTMTTVMGNGDGYFQQTSNNKVNWGAYIYLGLYKIEDRLASELTEELYIFLNAAVTGAIEYANTLIPLTEPRFTHGLMIKGTEGLEYDFRDRRPNRIYQWVHGDMNTVQHLHIHTLIIKGSVPVPNYLRRDIQPDRKPNEYIRSHMNIFTFCKLSTGRDIMSLSGAISDNMQTTTIMLKDENLDVERKSLLRCKGEALDNYTVNVPHHLYADIPYNTISLPLTTQVLPVLQNTDNQLVMQLSENNEFNGYTSATSESQIIHIRHDGSVSYVRDHPFTQTTSDVANPANVYKLYSLYKLYSKIRGDEEMTGGFRQQQSTITDVLKMKKEILKVDPNTSTMNADLKEFSELLRSLQRRLTREVTPVTFSQEDKQVMDSIDTVVKTFKVIRDVNDVDN